MEHLLNPAVMDIQISGIRSFLTQLSRVPDAISLTIGQPDFPTPDHVKNAAIAAILRNETTYTPNAGLPELRAAIARFVKVKYQQQYDPAADILVTCGASQAIDITLRTLVVPGAEVILPDPVYPGYAPIITMMGAQPVFVDTTQHDFALTAELIEAHLTPRTKAIILPYPSNPTGCTLHAAQLDAIANLLKSREVFVVSDEIYSELVFGGQHESIATRPGMREKTIVINGLSKSHAMTGWRIGYTLAPAEVTKHLLKVQQYSVSCASRISQFAAIEALQNGSDDAAPMHRAYQNRRDYIVRELRQMNLDVKTPNGAFYVFPSICATGLSSLEFAERLLYEARVGVVPGTAFGSRGEGYVRISYATNEANLEEAMRRLHIWLKST